MKIHGANAPTLGTNYVDKCLTIVLPTWGRWGITLIPIILIVVRGPTLWILFYVVQNLLRSWLDSKILDLISDIPVY